MSAFAANMRLSSFSELETLWWAAARVARVLADLNSDKQQRNDGRNRRQCLGDIGDVLDGHVSSSIQSRVLAALHGYRRAADEARLV